jgi:hypothetical protein
MKDDGQGEGFLARWSRRKAGVASAAETAPATASGAAANAAAALPAATAASTAPVAPGATTAAAPPAPLPTLADVAALTRDSDYARFMLPGVDGSVRNAAMKKLFSDPRFNVMDGLDTYIDDYGKPDPLPLAMLRRMNQAAALGLFDDEVPTEPTLAPPVSGDKACPDGELPGAMAPSTPPEPPPAAEAPARAEDDPDLRLQPDDVDRRPGAGPGPRA